MLRTSDISTVFTSVLALRLLLLGQNAWYWIVDHKNRLSVGTAQSFWMLQPSPAFSRSSCSNSTAASPRSPSGPLHGNSPPDRVSQALHAEKVYMAGWLWKQYHSGTHQIWRRTWVRAESLVGNHKGGAQHPHAQVHPLHLQLYLLGDRLCYMDDPLADHQPVLYIPLDRIPVRPLPRRYDPLVGAQPVRSSSWDPDSKHGAPAHVFSVQCGRHTHFMAAATQSEAEAHDTIGHFLSIAGWIRGLDIWSNPPTCLMVMICHNRSGLQGSQASGCAASSMLSAP